MSSINNFTRRIMIPDLLNQDLINRDYHDPGTVSSTPTSPSSMNEPNMRTSSFSSYFDSTDDEEDENDLEEYTQDVLPPTVIKVDSLPTLKLAKRHHHMVKTTKPNFEKTQGRPFSNKLSIQFQIHNDFIGLLTLLLHTRNFQIIQFNNIVEIDFTHLNEMILGVGMESNHLDSAVGSLEKIFKHSSLTLSPPQRDAMVFKRKNIIYDPSFDDDNNLRSVLQMGLNMKQFTFVRVLRDHLGHFIKLETVKVPQALFNSEWVKKQVCFPRYKSGMKLNLISNSCKLSVIIYNDLRFFYWDLQKFGLNYFMKKSISIINRFDL